MKKLLFIPFLFVCSMVIGQSSKIIGTPIKIGNLEVAQNDFPKTMSWSAAVKACADLGGGWRLPTKDELNLMYLNEDKIGAVASNSYWSSTEDGNGNAWWLSFGFGFQGYGGKNDVDFFVRAVRAF